MSDTIDESAEDASAPAEPTDEPAAVRRVRGGRRSAQLLAGVLAALLGFGIVAATRPASPQVALAGAREDDLVQLLDDLGQRRDRLELERIDLAATEQRLAAADDAERLVEAQRRATSLAVLAGTVPATGPGVVVTIADPRGTVTSAVLLDAMQELRDAGAYAMSVGPVRVVADTWFGAGPRPGTALVSGRVLAAPYVIRALGDPQTLSTAMLIPGGVADTVRTEGGAITVGDRGTVHISALQPLRTPQYARPVPTPSS